MRTTTLVFLAACNPIVHEFHFRADAPPEAQAWTAEAVAAINQHTGCKSIEISTAAPNSFSFAENASDIKQLSDVSGIGVFLPDSGDILVTDFATAPLIYFGGAASGDVSEQATIVMSAHEFGHALGLSHTTAKGDIMNAEPDMHDPISENAWGRYVEQLKAAGTECLSK